MDIHFVAGMASIPQHLERGLRDGSEHIAGFILGADRIRNFRFTKKAN